MVRSYLLTMAGLLFKRENGYYFTPDLTLTRFCGVNERGNSLQLLLVSDRTDISQ